jgi:hypothetical protein
MSASPTCGRSSPRQRSSPAPGNHCLLLRRAGKLQRRPRCQNRKGALPLQRKSRAATHAAVGDKTSWKLLAPTPLSRQIKQTGSRSAVTSITSPRSKKGGPLPRIKKVPAPGCVQARGKPAGARRGAPYNAPVVVQLPHKSALSIATKGVERKPTNEKGGPKAALSIGWMLLAISSGSESEAAWRADPLFPLF